MVDLVPSAERLPDTVGSTLSAGASLAASTSWNKWLCFGLINSSSPTSASAIELCGEKSEGSSPSASTVEHVERQGDLGHLMSSSPATSFSGTSTGLAMRVEA